MGGRVLVIAGSDSGGGAGIQADIKTIAALGGYATTAITAVTAQNTLGVHAVHAIPEAMVRLQIEHCLSDIGADAIKTGMLGDAALIHTVADTLARDASGIPVVIDPVMVAKGGATLLAEDAVAELKRRLLPLATLVTPNVPEAEVMTGITITGEESMRHAAEMLLTLGVPAIVLKGGHLPGPQVVDLLATDAGIIAFRAPRIDTRHTHGTGCTLASAIAVGLAQGMPLSESVARARAYVRRAIGAAPGLGVGHGPLGHMAGADLALAG